MCSAVLHTSQRLAADVWCCTCATDTHYRGGDSAMAQYLLALDALNFCFWPQPGLEYEHLARGLKASLPTVDIHDDTSMNCRTRLH
jgi:Potential Queuosine, Q, salvage protein family